MGISLDRLQGIVRNLLGVLEGKGISSVADLESRVGIVIPCGVGFGDYTKILLMPSKRGTRAYTISYIIEGEGVPVEIKVNNELGYSTIFVKADRLIPGFSLLGRDALNQIRQSKDLPYADLARLKRELESFVAT